MRITSSEDGVQTPLEIVQRSVYTPAPPAGVKVAFGVVELLNCAAAREGPDTTDQSPFPTAGILAAKLAGVVVQSV